MNKIDLDGRHAIVTRGGQALGFASGAKVTLWDIDAKVLADAAKTLGEAAPTARPRPHKRASSSS